MVVKDTIKPAPPLIEQAQDDRPIWEIITELSAELSDDDWREQPTDGAMNYRHYLYGQPKREVQKSAAEYARKDEAA